MPGIHISSSSSAMKGYPISLILAFASATRRSAAFVPNGRSYERRTNKLLAEKKVNNILSSMQLPSPGAVIENIFEGEVGQRGETFVIAQFSLLLCIAFGTVPFVNLELIGPAFIVAGLILVYKSAADLKENLSPWPVATDPKAGRGSLINEGIYSYIRHPMYSGLLMGMGGLSILTNSSTRLLLTFALYLVLDMKSNFEEASLAETYGSDYDEYKSKVQNKFFHFSIK